MAHSATDGSHEIRNPGPYRVSSGINTAFIAFAVIGIVAFGAGLMMDATRVWASFVQNHFYFMSLAIGGLFWAGLQWLCGAMWSAPIRRVAESFTAYLPVALIMFLVLIFGMHHLYIWTDPSHVHGDPVLSGKSGYLNTGFFVARNVIALGLWILFARKMIGNSLAQDSTRDYRLTQRNRALSPAFMIVFGITFTMVSFDILMSLDPHWFSTMFGVYCFAGLFYSTLALNCLLVLHLISSGHLRDTVNENHLHDLGKFMFAFTVFWAYIGFSQFMLIWYANLPEETEYFLRRMHDGWFWVSVFLLCGKFMVPFFLLISRDQKRQIPVLQFTACFMLVAQWIDMLWIVQPEFSPSGPQIGLIEIGVTLGFVGLFGIAVSKFMGTHSVLAIGDPRLAESVFHHHQ